MVCGEVEAEFCSEMKIELGFSERKRKENRNQSKN
jgi:hypothetical protein